MIIGPCTLVTGGVAPAVIENAAVRVAGSHIAHVGLAGNLAAAYPNETLWPARGRVVMPGFVNTHAHLARHLARGLGLRTAAEWRRYDRTLSPEDVRWAVTAALVEGVRHGVTTVCDFHRSDACRDLSLSEVIAAGKSAGVRVATCYGESESDTPAERKAAVEESLALAAELRRRREGRYHALVGVHATSLAGVDAMLHSALETAGEELAVHVDLELDITPAERWRATRAWRAGGPPALWAHAEAAPRGLVGHAQQRGDSLTSVSTGSSMVLVRDAEVAWGSDAAMNAPPIIDPGPASGTRAELQYRRLFVNGARWAERHFGEGLGTIASGAPADLVLVDYRPSTEFSSRTLLDHVWSGLLRAPVSGVMVAGEIVMDGGQMLSVDEREVSARARECAARVWERLG